MKLKTLKDIERSKLNPFLIADFDLKEEAIKWVKEMMETDGYTLNTEISFMDFFNITEEDLK